MATAHPMESVGGGERVRGCVHVPKPPAPIVLRGLERRVRGHKETPGLSQRAGPSRPFFCMTPALVSVSVHTYPGSQPGAAPWSSFPDLRGEDL